MSSRGGIGWRMEEKEELLGVRLLNQARIRCRIYFRVDPRNEPHSVQKCLPFLRAGMMNGIQAKHMQMVIDIMRQMTH